MKIKKLFLLVMVVALAAGTAAAQPDDDWDGQRQDMEEARGKLDDARGKMDKARNRMNRHWMRKPLEADEIAELEAFLKDVDPSRLEKLEELKEKRPEMYEKVAAKGYHEMKKMQWLKKKSPKAYEKRIEGFKLDGEVRDLARDYRQAGSEKEKTAIRNKMKPKLEKLFDMREEGRVWEIKKLKEKVVELEKTLEERKTNKSKIVEKRLDDMLGEDDELEW